MFWQSVKMAWSSVISNKMRSFLTMLGIIIGVLALVVLVSIVNGATSRVTDVVSSMGTDYLQVSIMDDNGKPLKLRDMDAMMEIDGVHEVAPLGNDYGVTVKGPKKTVSNVQVNGTTANYQSIQNVTLASGRWLKSADLDNHTAVAVINQALARDLLGARNTEAALGKTISLNGIPYTVVGVLGGGQNLQSMFMGEYTVYIPFSTMTRNSRTVASVTSMIITADSEEDLKLAEYGVKKFLNDRGGKENESYYVVNMSTVMDSMNQVTSIMSIALGGIAAISLLVGGIGIMNIMLVSVTERTREIGIRKAIGAGNGSIMMQFLIEALMVSLLGCALGVGFSWLALRIVYWVSGYDFAMDGGVVTVAVIFSMMIGLIFGIYPARKAAKMKPIDALHYT